MICSLRERWLTCEDPHAKAVAIITEVAEQYVRKEVLIGGLHQARDVILKREGVVLTEAIGAPAAAKSVPKKQKVQKAKQDTTNTTKAKIGTDGEADLGDGVQLDGETKKTRNVKGCVFR